MRRKSYKKRKNKVRDNARLCKIVFVMFMVTITYILMEISHNNISEAGNISQENNNLIDNNKNIRILIIFSK